MNDFFKDIIIDSIHGIVRTDEVVELIEDCTSDNRSDWYNMTDNARNFLPCIYNKCVLECFGEEIFSAGNQIP